jgi:nicotinate-nucleotide pyrophosphorylase (carboxylating)
MSTVEHGDLVRIVAAALAEDLHAGDVTARGTVPAAAMASARIVAKQALVVCGLSVVREVFRQVDQTLELNMCAEDGSSLGRGSEVVRLAGNARALLAGERTALNLLQRMSGVATLTREYVDAAGPGVRICDTRKTMPGLRALDRFAVRCGGGHNHRNDLGSGVLIKENHILAAGGVAAAVAGARGAAPHAMGVECEVTTLAELGEALAAGVDAVLLDNMSDTMTAEAVRMVDGRAVVEASGNITLERLPALAAIGVDVVSVGALTHSAAAVDLSMLFGD